MENVMLFPFLMLFLVPPTSITDKQINYVQKQGFVQGRNKYISWRS